MTLTEWVQPGVSFSLFYQRGNPNNMRYHVRGIVDGQVVVRYWRKTKGWWHYEVLDPTWFEVNDRYIKSRRVTK